MAEAWARRLHPERFAGDRRRERGGGRRSLKPRRNILVLCAHNSARSRMAEAFLRKQGGDRFTVQSAGLHATEIHPLTYRVVKEVGLPRVLEWLREEEA